MNVLSMKTVTSSFLSTSTFGRASARRYGQKVHCQRRAKAGAKTLNFAQSTVPPSASSTLLSSSKEQPYDCWPDVPQRSTDLAKIWAEEELSN
jgi:hypothetical protein